MLNDNSQCYIKELIFDISYITYSGTQAYAMIANFRPANSLMPVLLPGSELSTIHVYTWITGVETITELRMQDKVREGEF